MIQDKELRELFKVESEEYLNAIEALLLAIEKQPAGKEPFEELHRQLHSLKGSARIVGEDKIELIAHQVEDMASAVRKSGEAVNPQRLALFFKGLDAMRALTREALGGGSANVDLNLLHEPPPGPAPTPPTPPEEPAAPPPPSGDYRIETIRVETRKLDALLTHAGELVVMQTRLARLQEMMDSALASMETLNRRAAAGPRREAFAPYAALETRLTQIRDTLRDDNSYFDYIATALDEGVREARLLPLSTLFGLFGRMARDLAHAHGKEVSLETAGGDTKADKRIIEEMKDPLMHIIRNAIDHGVEPPDERVKAGKPRAGTVRLSATRTETNIVIEISDDGRGLDEDSILKAAVKQKLIRDSEAASVTGLELRQLIFGSGFSTARFVTDVSGRGVGLDVVKRKVESLKGSVEVRSAPGAGCAFVIKLPVTLTVARVLIVLAGKRKYAIPSEHVETSIRVRRRDIFPMEGGETIMFQGKSVPVKSLASILGAEASAPPAPADDAPLPCVILSAAGERYGALVDDLVDEMEVVLKPVSALLKRIRNVAGATILGDGEICMVLNPDDMLKPLRRRAAPAPAAPEEEQAGKRRVLLVEDSITTRTQEKRILEAGGYEVLTAVNGVEALSMLAGAAVDAVVSDVLMPEMDGLTMTRLIRQNTAYREMPVILVTTLASTEDRTKGLEAGANAYIPKPAFDQNTLLETLQRLI